MRPSVRSSMLVLAGQAVDDEQLVSDTRVHAAGDDQFLAAITAAHPRIFESQIRDLARVRTVDIRFVQEITSTAGVSVANEKQFTRDRIIRPRDIFVIRYMPSDLAER